MTTITVEIEEDNDLSALKELISRLGLKYKIAEGSGLLYTEEVKNEINRRYHDYQQGAEMINADASQQKIESLLAVN